MCLCACSVYVYLNCLFAMPMTVLFRKKTSGIRDHVFMCRLCIRVSQLLVCDAHGCAVQKKNVWDMRSCVYVYVLYTYISTACLRCPRTCCSIKVQDERSCVCVCLCMFFIRIFQLLVCDARDFAVQLKAGIRDHVFMCSFVYVSI